MKGNDLWATRPFKAIQQATDAAVKEQGVTGQFGVDVKVGGELVHVEGKVVNGAARIGTCSIPKA